MLFTISIRDVENEDNRELYDQIPVTFRPEDYFPRVDKG